MYYVFKNECCKNNSIAVAFKLKKEAKRYATKDDGTINGDLNITEKQKYLPNYVTKICGDISKDL